MSQPPQPPRPGPPSRPPGPPGAGPPSVRGRGGARGRAMAAGTTRPPMPSPGKPPMPGTGRGDPQQISQTMSKMTLAPVGPPQPQPPRGPPAPGRGRGQPPPRVTAPASMASSASTGPSRSGPVLPTQPMAATAKSAASASISHGSAPSSRGAPTTATQTSGDGSGRGSGSAGRGSGGRDEPDPDHASHTVAGVGRGRGAPAGPGTGIIRTRPQGLADKKGAGGTPFQALANYFNLESRIENWMLNQYEVKFNPSEDDLKAKKKMIRTLNPQIGENLFDGGSLWTLKNLGEISEHTVKNEDTNKIHQVRIKFTREVPPGDYQWLQLMNILVRKIFQILDLQMVGRDYYDPKASIDVKQYRLKIWPGYKTSIRQHEYGPLMCVDQGFKILRTDTALDQMKQAYKQSPSNFKSAATKLLLGQIVITRYNNKTYKIDDIAWDRNIMEEFEYRGNRISIAEYIWQKYQIKLTDKQQPLLISNPNAQQRRSGIDHPIPLVPEACNMTGLDDGQRADFKLMAEVAKTTRTAPPERVAALQRFSQRLKGLKEVDDELAKWDLKFGNVCQFKGRTLPPETLISGPKSKKTSYKEDNAEWNGMFRNPYQLYGPTSCAKWAVLYNKRDQESVQSFLKMLSSSASKMGYNLTPPLEKSLPDYRPGTYQNEMIPILQKKPDLIMVVIQNNKSDLYATTKKLCVVKHPTPSQVVTAKLLNKPKGLESVAMKVAMQMACKLGGEPWIVALPQITGLMIIGYDTWHNSTQKGTSVGGFVASTNSTLSRFFSQCTFHTNNEELCNNTMACLAQAVQIYQKSNGAPPQRIVFYRDGVGAGQEDNVRAQEVEQIKAFFERQGMNVKFTFIIVAKRINTRFYKKQGNQYVNPPSGSVFDDVVTLPERYDFFIVSQSVRQGTVNPTSYNVIDDTSGWTPDIIQKLTYKLTHLYYNWPGVVKVPMVCQYAHKLAFLIGESVHSRPHDAQQELLYYL